MFISLLRSLVFKNRIHIKEAGEMLLPFQSSSVLFTHIMLLTLTPVLGDPVPFSFNERLHVHSTHKLAQSHTHK